MPDQPARIGSLPDSAGPGTALNLWDAAGGDVFRAAIDASPMPMCLADPNQDDTPLVYVNPAFCQMTGYQPADVLGRNCRLLQGPDTDPDAVQALRTAIATKQSITAEMYNYRKDGSRFWNRMSLSPIDDASGNTINWLGSLVDLTRQHEAELVLQQSRRLEMLGTLAGAVAHEFNNLLTVVLANMEPMERDADERTLRRLTRATDAVRRAARLTHQLLSFARRPAKEERDTDLSHVLRGMDALFGQLAGHGLRVELDLPAEPVPIKIDVGELETVLLALVRQARSAKPPGGTLHIAIHDREPGWTSLAITSGHGWVDASSHTALDDLATRLGGGFEITVHASDGTALSSRDDTRTAAENAETANKATLRFPYPARPKDKAE